MTSSPKNVDQSATPTSQMSTEQTALVPKQALYTSRRTLETTKTRNKEEEHIQNQQTKTTNKSAESERCCQLVHCRVYTNNDENTSVQLRTLLDR